MIGLSILMGWVIIADAYMLANGFDSWIFTWKKSKVMEQEDES